MKNVKESLFNFTYVYLGSLLLFCGSFLVSLIMHNTTFSSTIAIAFFLFSISIYFVFEEKLIAALIGVICNSSAMGLLGAIYFIKENKDLPIIAYTILCFSFFVCFLGALLIEADTLNKVFQGIEIVCFVIQFFVSMYFFISHDFGILYLSVIFGIFHIILLVVQTLLLYDKSSFSGCLAMGFNLPFMLIILLVFTLLSDVDCAMILEGNFPFGKIVEKVRKNNK